MTDTRKPTPVEAAVSRLVEAETALDALRKVLDGHRTLVPFACEPRAGRMETDEEVIARLASPKPPFCGTPVVDTDGRSVGRVRHVLDDKVIVAAPKPTTSKPPNATAGVGGLGGAACCIAPKPIRLHAGQVWEKGGSEEIVTRLSRVVVVSIGKEDAYVHSPSYSDLRLTIDADWNVVDSQGWRCIAGPGAPPFDMGTL